MSVCVRTANGLWQHQDLHRILRSVWEWVGLVPELPAGGCWLRNRDVEFCCYVCLFILCIIWVIYRVKTKPLTV